MIILQAAKNIDTFMQMLGRVHRTGQVIPPKYTLLMSNAPAENRPGAVLVKKMASLNAQRHGRQEVGNGSPSASTCPTSSTRFWDDIVHRYNDRIKELDAMGDRWSQRALILTPSRCLSSRCSKARRATRRRLPGPHSLNRAT
jgi:hypothetical protein